MRLLRPLEYPANRPARRWVFDALVTLLAMVLAVPSLFHDAVRHGPPGVLPFIVLVLMTAPLIIP